MKKTAIFLSILAIAATAASVAVADDAAVYSANTVSVIKYQIPGNGALTCISMPVNPMNNGVWVWGETELAKNLAPGSKVYFWSGTGWDTYTKNIDEGTWPRTARNYQLAPGEAFFVRSVDGGADQEIAVVGELPVDETIPYDLQGSENLDVYGVSPYPVEGAFGTTSVASNLPPGSKVYFWSGTGWDTYTKNIDEGTWPRTARNYQFSIGEGIFIRPYGAYTNLLNARPFDWDN